MENPNSNNGESNNQISIIDINLAVEDFLSQKPKKQKLSNKEILEEILAKLEPVDFYALADTIGKYKLPQKHEIVICVEQILKVAREEKYDLARKDAFVFVYNCEYWSEVDSETLKQFLSQAAEKLGVNNLEARHYEYCEKLYKQFLKAAHLEPSAQKKGKVLINLANGTFEIDGATQRFRAFQKADFITYQLPFEYNEMAEAPKFHSYLNQVLPEKELQDILAEFLAYPFIKHLKLEKVAILYGFGANGKSVCTEITSAVYGPENITNFSLSNLMEENNRALIANKLLNFGSEINASTMNDVFKILASGEPIQARLKYGNSFLMQDYARLCFNSNELPRNIEQLLSYFRRLIIIPFRVTIPENEQDPELAQKIIENELPGVFNWILKGARRLVENKKFTESKIVAAEIQTYRKDSDSVAIFLEESNLVHHSTKTRLLKDIYSAYREFCYSDGYKSLNKKNFSKRLQQIHGYSIERRNTGNNVYCEYSRNNAEGGLVAAEAKF